MADSQSPEKSYKKLWIALGIIVACVVIGLVIWKMIFVGHQIG